MIKLRLLALLILAVSMSMLTRSRGDIEPEEHDDVQADETSTSCPGIGTCTRKLYPGDYYCGFCLFFGCGCNCLTADLHAENQVGNCITVTNDFGETEARCSSWHAVSYFWIPGTVCTSWHG